MPNRTVIKARGLSLAGDGAADKVIARHGRRRRTRCGGGVPSSSRGGVDAVGSIAPGRGRSPEIAQEMHDAIVHHTLHMVPDDESTRTMGERHGAGKDTVARIWKPSRLWPSRTETFKLSHVRGSSGS